MTRLLQRALNERGDVVDVAMTGEDAVTMASLAEVDVVLLETFMRRPDQMLTRAHLSTGSRGWCLGKANAVWAGIVATLTPADAMSSGDAGAGLRRGSDHPAYA